MRTIPWIYSGAQSGCGRCGFHSSHSIASRTPRFSNWRRERLYRKLPWLAVPSEDVALGFLVTDDAFLLGIPLDQPAQPESDIPQVTGNHRIVADLDV